MKKLLVFALLLTFITKGLNAQNHYNCTTSITMKKNGGTITNYSLILPTPHSCNYQDIEDFTKNTGDVKEVKTQIINIFLFTVISVVTVNHYQKHIMPLFILCISICLSSVHFIHTTRTLKHTNVLL